MVISGAIGVLFQFVFRAEDKAWDTERYVETVCIGISRLANSMLYIRLSVLLRAVLSDHHRIIPAQHKNERHWHRVGDVEPRQHGLSFHRNHCRKDQRPVDARWRYRVSGWGGFHASIQGNLSNGAH